jgi:hypothetical protein
VDRTARSGPGANLPAHGGILLQRPGQTWRTLLQATNTARGQRRDDDADRRHYTLSIPRNAISPSTHRSGASSRFPPAIPAIGGRVPAGQRVCHSSCRHGETVARGKIQDRAMESVQGCRHPITHGAPTSVPPRPRQTRAAHLRRSGLHRTTQLRHDRQRPSLTVTVNRIDGILICREECVRSAFLMARFLQFQDVEIAIG